MTVEDIYMLLKADQNVTIISDKFTWSGKSDYIPSDYMEMTIVDLYVCEHSIVMNLGVSN